MWFRMDLTIQRIARSTNHYDTLGLRRTDWLADNPSALTGFAQAAKQAYKALVLSTHPDKNPDSRASACFQSTSASAFNRLLPVAWVMFSGVFVQKYALPTHVYRSPLLDKHTTDCIGHLAPHPLHPVVLHHGLHLLPGTPVIIAATTGRRQKTPWCATVIRNVYTGISRRDDHAGSLLQPNQLGVVSLSKPTESSFLFDYAQRIS